MTRDENVDAEIALTAFFLKAHPEADIEAVLRRFANEILKLVGASVLR